MRLVCCLILSYQCRSYLRPYIIAVCNTDYRNLSRICVVLICYTRPHNFRLFSILYTLKNHSNFTSNNMMYVCECMIRLQNASHLETIYFLLASQCRLSLSRDGLVLLFHEQFGLTFWLACNFMFDASKRRHIASFSICSWKRMTREAFSWLAVGFISLWRHVPWQRPLPIHLSLSGLMSSSALLFLPIYTWTPSPFMANHLYILVLSSSRHWAFVQWFGKCPSVFGPWY
jgi:hypothetical protein